MNQARNKPLEGIRALELSEIWAGPFCGCLLGDMGAEVIKLESKSEKLPHIGWNTVYFKKKNRVK